MKEIYLNVIQCDVTLLLFSSFLSRTTPVPRCASCLSTCPHLNDGYRVEGMVARQAAQRVRRVLPPPGGSAVEDEVNEKGDGAARCDLRAVCLIRRKVAQSSGGHLLADRARSWAEGQRGRGTRVSFRVDLGGQVDESEAGE